MLIKNLSLLLVSLVLCSACKSKWTSREVVNVNYSEALTRATIQIQYSNANTKSSASTPSNLVVSVVGSGASRIKNASGGTEIMPNAEGLVGMAVDSTQLPSTSRPLYAAVWAQADQYFSKATRLSLTSEDNIVLAQGLIHKSLPPEGIAANQVIYKSQALTLQTPDVTNAKAQWNIPARLSLQALPGSSLTGDLYFSLYYYSPSVAAPFLPDGVTTLYNALDEKGNKLPAFIFKSLVYFQLEAFASKGGIIQKANTASEVIVEIRPDIKRANGQAIRQSDVVPLWRYDLTGNRWIKHANVPILWNNQTNRFYIKVSLSEFTHYALADIEEVCASGSTFRFVTNLPKVDTKYYAKLVETTTGETLYETYLDLNNGAQRLFAGHLKRTVRLQIYSANDYFGGNTVTPIYSSSPFYLCDQTNYVASIRFPTLPEAVTISPSFQCLSGKVLDASKLPSFIYIQYQLAGTSTWTDLVTIPKSAQSVQTFRLELGKRYRFRASPNPAAGWAFTQTSYQTVSASLPLTITYNGPHCE